MLSYPIDEAETLLESKLSAATQSLSNCEEDLDFLREQITVQSPGPGAPDAVHRPSGIHANGPQTMEVAIARVYNWDVVQKRKEKTDEETKGVGKDGAEPNG